MTSATDTILEKLAVNTIRTLAIDAINKANSGHPGMPMGSAPMAYELWTKFMQHNPANPKWFNRDRFVLSAGHGSMLLYSLLHLTGYDLPLEELQNFRQWGSKTPGHPEYGHTAGVEATTGPLGQGFAMAVGMAIAEEHLGDTYNKDGFRVVDHYTYAICGDGDLMEGISGEAASLAGHLKLGKLIVLYDSNDISLDGELSMSFSEDVAKRFEGYGWQVLRVADGNDLAAIHQAIATARADYRPTLIEVKTIIGYGSPNKSGKGGEHGSHGAPLGAEEAVLTKKFYEWPGREDFYIPAEVKEHFAAVKNRGIQAEAEWNKLFAAYREAHPVLGAQLELAIAGGMPEGWDSELPVYSPADKAVASRVSSESALNAIAKNYPMLVGGSADLETSTKTGIRASGRLTPADYSGRNIFFGVREFAMGAAVNGLTLHGGVKAFSGTFFIFSDYMKPAIRLGAIMGIPAIYLFTHDSIAVGEDGPTHEPIEQLAGLRAIPGLTVLRPADGNEVSQAWAYAAANTGGPVVLVFTRQALPNLEGTAEKAAAGLRKGAYVLADAPDGKPAAQIIATGSEVALAMEAQKKLAAEGIPVRVISMPSMELFAKQPQEYRDSVILPDVRARVAVEMAASFGWHKYVGLDGDTVTIDHFGASAPAGIVLKEFGFTVDNVVAKVKGVLR